MGPAVGRAGAVPGEESRALAAWRRLAARVPDAAHSMLRVRSRVVILTTRARHASRPWTRFLPGHPWPRFLPGHPDRALAACRRLAHGDALRLNLRPRAHALQAIDYDGFARCESRLHHPQAVDDRTELHRPVLGLVARAYDQYV